MSKKKTGSLPELLYKRLGNLVKAKRDDERLSKSAFARSLNIHRGKLLQIEDGSASLPVEEVDRLVVALNLNPNEVWPQFLEGNKTRVPEPTHFISVPATSAERVHIVVNFVEREELPENA